jgi:hypothetical protein
MEVAVLLSAIKWLTVALLGGIVGAGELVSRYRDAPQQALFTRPAFFYIGVNIAASVTALCLIRAFGWTFGLNGTNNPAALVWTQVLVAGAGAMALFRSSLFTVRAGGADIAVGPSSFLQVILAAADGAVDRLRAEERMASVGSVMNGVSYAKAEKALPAYCLAAMQNLSADEQKKLGSALDTLASSNMEENLKVLILGMSLMNVVGPEVLQAAVAALGDQIH